MARQFGKTAAGRFAKNVSWYGRKGGALGKKVGRALGGAQGAATGAAVGSVAGKLIPIAGAAIAVGGALNDFRKSIQQAADSALESKRKFAEVSGSQAAIFAQQDVQQLLRDIKFGEKTAGSTQELADSVNTRKDQFAPLEAAVDNATNRLLATGQDMLNSLLATPIELLTGAVETFDGFVKDFRETFIGPAAKKEEFGTLGEIAGRLEEEGRAAEARARAAMDRIRGIDRGRLPRDF